MKKSLLVMLVCGALVGAFCLPALWAVEPPKDMEIKLPEGTATKAPVKFSHEKHKAANVTDCKACHHNWDGKSATGLKCSDKGCHDNFDPSAKADPHSWYKAFHDMSSDHSCLGCHKKMKAEGKNSPIACNQCHPQ